MSHEVTTDTLRKAEARYQRAFRRSEDAREERNRLLCHAVAGGWSHARIAEATGLTRARVGQIAVTCKTEATYA
jgi:hypothetical protein